MSPAEVTDAPRPSLPRRPIGAPRRLARRRPRPGRHLDHEVGPGQDDRAVPPADPAGHRPPERRGVVGDEQAACPGGPAVVDRFVDGEVAPPDRVVIVRRAERGLAHHQVGVAPPPPGPGSVRCRRRRRSACRRRRPATPPCRHVVETGDERRPRGHRCGAGGRVVLADLERVIEKTLPLADDARQLANGTSPPGGSRPPARAVRSPQGNRLAEAGQVDEVVGVHVADDHGRQSAWLDPPDETGGDALTAIEQDRARAGSTRSPDAGVSGCGAAGPQPRTVRRMTYAWLDDAAVTGRSPAEYRPAWRSDGNRPPTRNLSVRRQPHMYHRRHGWGGGRD